MKAPNRSKMDIADFDQETVIDEWKMIRVDIDCRKFWGRSLMKMTSPVVGKTSFFEKLNGCSLVF